MVNGEVLLVVDEVDAPSMLPILGEELPLEDEDATVVVDGTEVVVVVAGVDVVDEAELVPADPFFPGFSGRLVFSLEFV